MTKPSKKVLVIQRRMTHYRTPFFEALRAELARRDCELVLAAGVGTEEELSKNDSDKIAWAEELSTQYFADGRICWQSFKHLLKDVDCVVFTPENKLIFNLYVQYFVHDIKVVLWGHGANLQGDSTSLREKFKRYNAKKTDWWLAYTSLSIPLIEQSGFPAERITVLNNSVDTTELQQLHNSVTEAERQAVRTRLGLTGDKMGIYVGSLYKEKRIKFMLDAAIQIKQQLPGFELLIIGAGHDKSIVEAYAKTHAWIHYLGPQKGRDKVEHLAISDVMINPGLVGLGVLDSFVCRTPLFTTDCGLHSPEISYLENEVNGLITRDTLEDYVAAVVNVLADETRLARLKAGCAESAKKYTVENMAVNFADGIVACLAAPAYR